MSAAYWSAVLENLPHAVIVFDRFHIMKLMNERLDELRRAMVREAEGSLKKKIKGTRFLLLRNSENLQDEHLPRLDQALQLNEPLLLGWYLKGELRELWNQPHGRAMKDGRASMVSWEAFRIFASRRATILLPSKTNVDSLSKRGYRFARPPADLWPAAAVARSLSCSVFRRAKRSATWRACH